MRGVILLFLSLSLGEYFTTVQESLPFCQGDRLVQRLSQMVYLEIGWYCNIRYTLHHLFSSSTFSVTREMSLPHKCCLILQGDRFIMYDDNKSNSQVWSMGLKHNFTTWRIERDGGVAYVLFESDTSREQWYL